MTHRRTSRFTLSASATLGLTLLASFPAIAQIAPDAGQTSRELQRQPALSPPKTTAPLRIEGDTAPKGIAPSSVRIAVKAIRITDTSIFAASELDALVADLIGGEHTLAELDAGADRITTWYHEHGYAIAQAYLPVQDIKDGVVTISVLEGRIGEARVSNQSRLSDELVNGYLGTQGGTVLQTSAVDRALLLLGDTPGVANPRASLTPGASVGTSDLIIELDPSAPYSGSVELDNHGNRYTGEFRLGGGLVINSPLNLGDQLSLRALTSTLDLSYSRLAYQLPVGNNGLRLGAAYSATRYRLGKDFISLQSHGSAKSTSLFAVYPLLRSQTRNLSATVTMEDKKLNDHTDAPVSATDKNVKLLNFGLAGSQQDGLWGGGMTSIDLSLVAGNLSMDAGTQATDSTSAQTNGGFSRLSYTANRLQRLTDTETLVVTLSGQQANKNLNSSEKFSLGGASGVRAYPQGEGSGDVGWMTNLELRHAYAPNLTAIAFYDVGSVNINRRQFAPGNNSRSISGAGFGVNTSYAGVSLKAYLAWRTGGGQPLAEPVSVTRTPRAWVQMSMVF